MASLVIGPTNRNPDYARGENQYARILGAQTAVLVPQGGGMIASIMVGIAGTTAKFYDTPAGGTTDDTTQILTVDIDTPTVDSELPKVAFSKGLTVIVAGGATTDMTVSFRGAQTVSTRFFGTQLDGNAGRPVGTSADKTVPDAR